MVTSEHSELVEGRQRFIVTDILDSEESYGYGSTDDDSSALHEEYDSGSGEFCMSTCVTEVVTKYLEEMHQSVKSSPLSSYILKPPSLLTQVFKENNKSQEKVFKHRYNFEAQ